MTEKDKKTNRQRQIDSLGSQKMKRIETMRLKMTKRQIDKETERQSNEQLSFSITTECDEQDIQFKSSHNNAVNQR